MLYPKLNVANYLFPSEKYRLKALRSYYLTMSVGSLMTKSEEFLI